MNETDGYSRTALSNLHLLTVVVPTYNRQNYLLRVCAYWAHTSASLVIIDGSPESYENNLKYLLKQNSKIKYIHLAEKFNTRLKYASNFINTPYAVHAADDEFLTFSGLSSAIKLLEESTDIVACSGQTIKFNPYRSNRKIDYGEGYTTLGYNVLQNSIFARLDFVSKNYKPVTFYAVMRSEVWKKSWGNMWSSDIAMVLEFEQILTTYICGKLATVDEVVRLWSVEELPTVDPKLNRVMKIEHWWVDKNYTDERKTFISKLAREICDYEAIQLVNSENIVLQVMENYCKNPLSFNPLPKSFYGKLKWLARKVLKQLFSPSIIHLLKLVRNKVLAKVVDRVNYLWPKLQFGTLDSMIARKDQLPFIMDERLIRDLQYIEEMINSHYNR